MIVGVNYRSRTCNPTIYQDNISRQKPALQKVEMIINSTGARTLVRLIMYFYNIIAESNPQNLNFPKLARLKPALQKE